MCFRIYVKTTEVVNFKIYEEKYLPEHMLWYTFEAKKSSKSSNQICAHFFSAFSPLEHANI